MVAYAFRRVLATIPVMVVVAVFVFSIMHLGTSDPAVILAGETASPAHIEQIRQQLGLNLPLAEQFWIWLADLARGDLGVSIFSQTPVTTLIAQRAGPTLMLTICAMTFAVLLAVPLGIIAAWRANTFVDRAVTTLSVLTFSFPVFVVGYVLVYVLSIRLGWFPVQGYRPISDGIGPFLHHMVLPAASIGGIYAALIARITRATMIEVLREDYIRTAKAKGLPTFRILIEHALRNASVPIVTVIGVGIALMISGVVVTESVFSIPGLGRLTADAILHRDYPVIQGVVLLFSAVYVGINLTVDMLYTVLDPRIRYY